MNKILSQWQCAVIQQRRYLAYKPIKRPSLTKEATKANADQSTSTPTDLTTALRTKIKASGPISVADYMKNVLTNPSAGYYMKRDVFGQQGDFITSPEIGQIFGELIAVWFLTEWQKCGSPSPVQLIELGPGRGTLAKDILRVFARFRLGTNFSLHLVEISPHLSLIQAQRLCFQHTEVVDTSSGETFYRKGETVSGAEVFWYRRLEDVPKDFSIVLAHEFFDALPIHKLQKEGSIWREILIDVDPNSEGKFRFVVARNQTPIVQLFRPLDNEQRSTLEYSIEADAIVQSLANRIESYGGFALIVDYGHSGDKTDTFRAFKNHKLHDPLVEPGVADLTADVDFRRLKFTAESADTLTFGPVEQSQFLERMGGNVRLQALMENASPDTQEMLKSSYEMLTHPDKMGSRFKFFSIFPQALKDHLVKFPVNGFS